eukprot:COSAG05_NODE_21435_length_272_cov_0.560694_1_plen_67_part_01
MLVELGGKIARFREVVVFDGARVYPAYLLASVKMRESAEPQPDFFNDTATTEIYTGEDTLSLHDALP